MFWRAFRQASNKPVGVPFLFANAFPFAEHCSANASRNFLWSLVLQPGSFEKSDFTNRARAGTSSFFSACTAFSPPGHEQSAVFGVGAVAHPDKIKAASTVLGHQHWSGLNMWLLIAEMVLALGLIVFIMWWTLRARVDHPVEKPKDDVAEPDKNSGQD
jgi:hypothetical protein